MRILENLSNIWANATYPFLIYQGLDLHFNQVATQQLIDLNEIKKGDVVAIIGDFNAQSIMTLLRLMDMAVTIVPLTVDTRHEHEYFFESAFVDVIIEDHKVKRRVHEGGHAYIEKLRNLQHSGLVLFSTGTTGRPKAILHDLTLFLKRFETPRPTLRTLNFLLFDHITSEAAICCAACLLTISLARLR